MRVLAILALFLMTSASAQTMPADTVDYPWVVDMEDPEGDHVGPGAISGANAPNTLNPESDILRIQMTDDATAVVIKVTFGTCDFEVPTGLAFIIMEAGDIEYTASYKDGCSDAKAADVDSVLTPVNGDPDIVSPGLRAEGVPEENAIYLFADYSENGLQAGDVITFSRIHTGRQFTDPGRYTFGLDEADPFSFVVGSGADLTTPEVPAAQTILGEATTGTALEFANATSDTYLLNWTAVQGDLVLAVHRSAGNVSVTFGDSTALVAQNETMRFDGNTTQVLNLTFDGFVGSVALDLEPWSIDEVDAEMPEDGAGNSTAEPVQDVDAPDDDKESPGLPLFALLVGLALLVRRQR